MLFGRQPESPAKESQFSAGTREPGKVQSKGEISSVDDDFSVIIMSRLAELPGTALHTIKGALAKGDQVGG